MKKDLTQELILNGVTYPIGTPVSVQKLSLNKKSGSGVSVKLTLPNGVTTTVSSTYID